MAGFEAIFFGTSAEPFSSVFHLFSGPSRLTSWSLITFPMPKQKTKNTTTKAMSAARKTAIPVALTSEAS